MNHLETQLTALLEQLITEQTITDKKQMAQLRQQCIAVLDTVYNHFPERNYEQSLPGTAFIASDAATIEIIDHHSQMVYRRDVSLRYEENLNGLKLIGENFEGQASEIVFLSQAGMLRLNDLLGKGSDQDLCENHSHGTVK